MINYVQDFRLFFFLIAMTLVILLALMTGLCIALPHQDFDAAEILLDSFSDSEVG